jgi:hypothetical protein
MSMPTLLDIVKANGNDAVVGLVDETIKAHPELTLVPARTIVGLNYRTRVRTALGLVTGSFRDANTGTTPIKHTYENRLVETFILNPRFECDKAVADRYEGGPQVYIAEEAQGIMEGEMQGLGAQFYYGNAATGGNAKGHPGLIGMYDAANMVVDAGGTTDDVASSVWLVSVGPKALQWVWGANGSFAMSPVREETIVDPNDSTKRLDGYVSSLTAYPGLQVASLLAVVRIKKLTTDSGKGLTDALIADAMSKFPVGMAPNVIFMNRRSRKQLQLSRTVVINTSGNARAGGGVSNVADVPTEAYGIPIACTDSILNTEKLAL